MATRYRFGVEEFERLFPEVKHPELLEGGLYEMSPIAPRHVLKPALHAQAGIPEVWGVNLVEGFLGVYRYPQGDHYRPRELVFPGETKAPLAFPDRPIPWS